MDFLGLKGDVGLIFGCEMFRECSGKPTLRGICDVVKRDVCYPSGLVSLSGRRPSFVEERRTDRVRPSLLHSIALTCWSHHASLEIRNQSHTAGMCLEVERAAAGWPFEFRSGGGLMYIRYCTLSRPCMLIPYSPADMWLGWGQDGWLRGRRKGWKIEGWKVCLYVFELMEGPSQFLQCMERNPVIINIWWLNNGRTTVLVFMYLLCLIAITVG